MTKLRVEFLAPEGSPVKVPFLVDVERDEILPGQVACEISGELGTVPVITVRFEVDGHDVYFGVD